MEIASQEELQILLVEDEKFHQVMAKKFLDKGDLNYRLHIASDGEKAMDFLYRRASFGSAPRPDIILLDLGLPGMTGREVFRQIKADPDLKQIPVIVLSGTDPEEIPKELSQHAGAYCFTKWMEMKDFMSLIKTVQTYRATFSKKAA